MASGNSSEGVQYFTGIAWKGQKEDSLHPALGEGCGAVHWTGADKHHFATEGCVLKSYAFYAQRWRAVGLGLGAKVRLRYPRKSAHFWGCLSRQ